MNATRLSENFLMRHATAIAILVMTSVLALAVVVFYRQDESTIEARRWVNHTYQVRSHIYELLNKLEDAETGMRGYLVAGEELYLEPYKDALRNSSDDRPKSDELTQHHSISEEIAILRRLTSDNPDEQQNVDDAQRGAESLLDYFSAAIAARKTTDAKTILQKIDLRRGKEMMDGMRNLVARMLDEEDHLLTLRQQADESNMRQSEILVFSGLAIIYALKMLGVWIYQSARRRNQSEILRYTEQLERNEEELKMQQEELKASNEEIEASNEELEEQNTRIRQQTDELTKSKKLIEEKIKEVELASQYKSDFLANMSHELRTPLNSLLILARSLASNEDGNLTESQIEEARIIHGDGLELLALINDILDLSKVEAGKLNVVVEDVAINDIVGRLAQQFSPIAADKGLAFPREMETGLMSSIYTDMQRIEQILKNLLSNAFKFTEKGSVTLKVHRPEEGSGYVIAFSVIDTGIGIEAAKFEDIFEAFQQEEGSTDRHYGGTGLGLTIARKLAHLLGGEIRVASAKGQGSTFTLLLPAKGKTAESAPANAESVDERARETRTAQRTMPRQSMPEFIPDDRELISAGDKVLLIIEDDRNFALTLMKTARKRGYKCLAAGNGKTGLFLAKEEPVTAILLDLKLPDIDGMQVLDQLKSDLRSRHIPVHIVTGSPDNNALSLRKGAIGYLTKPVLQEEIDAAFARIETLLQGGTKHILLAEDDPGNRIAIQTLLQKKDVQLTPAGTGAEALGYLRNASFDCVILDLRLPDMTGFEWLEKAERESGDNGLPPIIVYTAKELTEEENLQLNRYTGSIIIKGAKSPERLLDEVTLFLHSVESTLSKDQREMIRMQHDPDKALHGRTILLTDDDLRNTFALSKLLKKHGMNVIIADNGRMALDKLHENRAINLVIMDIMMPVMDGYQAMRAIRADRTYGNLPIIALTARAMPEEQEKCIAAGANDYMTKPVDVERLLTLLRVCLFKQEMAA